MWFRRKPAAASAFAALASDADLTAALAASEVQPVVLYKHSATCGFSFMARREVQDFRATHDTPVYELVVQQARPLSNAIASQFGIRHETPQVIVVYRGQPIAHASHGAVSAEDLTKAVQQAHAPL